MPGSAVAEAPAPLGVLAELLAAQGPRGGPARDAEPAEESSRRLVLFRLAERVYGIELLAVREILTYRRPTRLPGAPAFVAGLINVRGTVVTVLDLGTRLGDTPAATPAGSIILVEHGTKVVGVAVDEVMDVQSLADRDVDAPAPAREESAAGVVLGVGRVGDRVVVLLDVHALIAQVMA